MAGFVQSILGKAASEVVLLELEPLLALMMEDVVDKLDAGDVLDAGNILGTGETLDTGDVLDAGETLDAGVALDTVDDTTERGQTEATPDAEACRFLLCFSDMGSPGSDPGSDPESSSEQAIFPGGSQPFHKVATVAS